MKEYKESTRTRRATPLYISLSCGIFAQILHSKSILMEYSTTLMIT